MSTCYCDHEPAQFYVAEIRTARKQHKCNECGRAVQPGERYEHVRAKWDGDMATVRTCVRCLSLREWVKAHVPCFCWAHHDMIEDAINTAQNYAHEAPGLLFGAYRRRVLIKRAAWYYA